MARFILITRITGVLAFLTSMFFFLDGATETAVIIGAVAALCVAIVLAGQLADLYQSYFLKKRRL
jgi:hypothetical protein